MKVLSKKGARVAATVLVALLVMVAGVITWERSASSGKTMMTAMFADASPLVAGNDVRIYGMKVGTIKSVALVNGQAQVTMELDKGTPALHRDAHAVIKPVSLLGERYVQLQPGSDSAPFLGEHPVIPASQTSASVDLDQVLNSLNDPTSASLAALLTTAGEGMNGHGADTAAALKALQPAMTQTGELGDVLNQQNRVLTQLIDSASGSAHALADQDGQTLDRVVGNAQRTLSIVAQNRQALDSSLKELPGTLAKARRTLANLGGVADQTTPALQDIRPITDNLTNVTGELHQFSRAADPALGSLPPVLGKLNGMLDQARPVVDTLGPASGDLRSVTGSVRPIGETMLNHAPGTPSHLENLMTGAANWGMATSGYDGLSHYFRGVVGVTPETVRNLGMGALPPVGPLDQGNVPRDPNNPGMPRQQPSIPQIGPVPSLGLPPLPGSPAVAPSPDPGNATGLNPNQERSMVDQLLGGK